MPHPTIQPDTNEMSSSMDSPKYSSLRILFITDPKRQDMDTFLKVVPLWNPNATVESQKYEVTFKEDRQRMTSIVEGGEYLVDYVRNILELVARDANPCELVQFDIPNVPSVLTKHHCLSSTTLKVVSILEHLVHAWPTYVPRSTTPPLDHRPLSSRSFVWSMHQPSTSRVNRHMYFDEDGNEFVDLTMDDDEF